MLPGLDAVSGQRLEAEVLTESQLDESDYEAIDLSIDTERLMAAGDVLELFDGVVNDVGLKTLQLYMANLPMKLNLGGLYCSPLPCRRCLGQRIWCAKISKSDSKCRSCKKVTCSHDLKGVRPDWRRYHHLPSFDPSLCGVQKGLRDTCTSTLVVEQTNESGEGEVEPIDLDADSDESVDVSGLASLFNYDENDPGLTLLRKYTAHPPVPSGRSSGLSTPSRIPVESVYE